MEESTPLEDIETGQRSKHCRYFKMKVLADHSSEAINKVIEGSFDEKCIVFSDKSKSYLDLGSKPKCSKNPSLFCNYCLLLSGIGS